MTGGEEYAMQGGPVTIQCATCSNEPATIESLHKLVDDLGIPGEFNLVFMAVQDAARNHKCPDYLSAHIRSRQISFEEFNGETLCETCRDCEAVERCERHDPRAGCLEEVPA
jgi:hypothetical protein